MRGHDRNRALKPDCAFLSTQADIVSVRSVTPVPEATIGRRDDDHMACTFIIVTGWRTP